MQLVGGAPAGGATALQLCGRCFLPLRAVLDALDELEQRGLVERVGQRRWRLTHASPADARQALPDPHGALP
jgi:DNA-binding GntR family transcriptional regulator